MSARSSMTVVAAALAIAAAAAVVGIALPGYRAAAALEARHARLEAKVAELPERTAEVEALADELAALHRHAGADRRAIPGEAAVAELVRRLTLPADGTSVREQTFAASTPAPAIPGDETLRVVPLRVEMEARFDAIFALLRAAETMDRLVRVASIRITAGPDGAVPGAPLTASVDLEAVFDPRAGEEGR